MMAGGVALVVGMYLGLAVAERPRQITAPPTAG
jgi:hypothetical protein